MSHLRPVTHLLSDDDIWPSLAVSQLDVRLVVHPVQVLMKTVQQEGQQLLRVVLLDAAEPGRVLADRELPAEGGGGG